MNMPTSFAGVVPAGVRASKPKRTSRTLNSLAALFFFGVIVAANWMLADGGGRDRVIAWLATLVGMISILACVGDSINHRPAGIIIDNRNRVSLSKFQAVGWTVVVLSALITFVSWRLHVPAVANPLDVRIPPELLVAMGISAVSLAATPALLSLKTHVEPDLDEKQAATAVGALDNEGKVHGRPDAQGAMWSDMFRGDEVSNADSPDLGKVQQAFVTALLLILYGVHVTRNLMTTPAPELAASTLPAIGDEFVWLLALSHAGYLGYKAAPHSRTKANHAVAIEEEVG